MPSASSSSCQASAECGVTGKIGPAPSSGTRTAPAIARGRGHGDEAPRLPFEQQELDGEEDGRERRGEDGRHAAGGAGHEQRLALRGGEMKRLREERAERAARHDDRPFGAERPAAADRDGRRKRLEQRDLRAHPASADQDRLHRLGNAVAPDLFRAVARHESDEEPAHHRHQHGPHAEVVPGGRHELRAEAMIVEQIGEAADKPHQRHRDERADYADHAPPSA